ncbi:MAG: YidB family protein [Paracoccaceae bacterium]
MGKSTPSLLALLGLVAYAGYQNRGKISEMLDDAHKSQAASSSNTPAGGEGLFSSLGKMFQSQTAGSTLSSGLSELVNRFRSVGQGAAADSWVAPGPNAPMPTPDLEAAIGDETLTELQAKTGLSRAELVQRLSQSLPDVVNRLTPNGRVPTDAEAQSLA